MTIIKKIVRILFCLLLVWCGFTEALQWFSLLFFNMWIAGDWFLILLTSDAKEVLKFVTQNQFPLVVAVCILALGVGTGIASLRMSRKAWWITVGCFLVYMAAGIAWIGRGWTPAYLAYDTLRGWRDYTALIAAGQWSEDDARVADEAASRSDTASLPTVVMVVGESLTSSRMGVYGYANDTTPRLAELVTNGLEVLPPRRATGSYTAKALKDLFVDDGMSLVRKMRRRGYHPILLSAQGHWERYCGVELMVFAACENKRYVSDELPEFVMPDMMLGDWVREELADMSRPKLLIVHMLGSHYPYKDRYPGYWTKPVGFDDYDMSVKFTDMVLANIIMHLPKDAVLVFTSDHGESPNSGSWRNSDDPDLWSVPLLVYPKGGLNRVPEIARAVSEAGTSSE